MIEKVRLLNFISHAETEIPFRPGTTVFVGRNGSGKSSVIDGITYALYGKHMRGDNANLVKGRSQSASVAVEFSCGSKQYVAERKINKKGQLEGSVLMEVSVDGSIRQLAAGERKQFGESMSSEVSKIFGLDYDRMRIAGIIQQGELDAIVNLTSKDLKDLVNSVIGTDRLDTAYGGMKDAMDSFRETIRSKHGGRDDRSVDSIKEEIAREERELEASMGELFAHERDLGVLEKRREELSEGISAMGPLKEKVEKMEINVGLLIDYVKRRLDELEKRKEDAEATISNAVSYLSLLEKKSAVSEGIVKTVGDQRANSTRLQRLAQEIGELQALGKKPDENRRIVEKTRKALALVSQGANIRRALSEVEDRIRLCDSELVRLESDKGKLEGYQSAALKLEFKDNTCPVCGSKVEKINEIFDRSSIERHLAEHKAAIEAIRQEIGELKLKRELAADDVASLEEAVSVLQDQNITSEKDVDRLATENAQLKARLETLPELTVSQAAARSEEEVLRSKLEELQKQESQINVAESYLRDHGISSRGDVQKLRDEKDKLAHMLSSFPAVRLDSLRATPDPRQLSPAFAIDDHAKQMLDDIAALANESAEFDKDEYGSMRNELDRLQRTIIPQKNGDIGACRSRTENAGNRISDLKASLEGLQAVAEYMVFLESVRGKVFYRDGQVSMSLRSWALTQIGAKASEYARLFGIGISRVTLKEKARDMTIECYGGRGYVETSSLSGGEKVAIALALRFALAYMMGGYKLDFIILDEPTVHLDMERKSSLVEVISRLGGENSPLKQIILITHDSEIFENADVDEVWSFEQTSEGSRVTRGTGDRTRGK